MSKIVIVYHSGYGHNQEVAEAVAAGSRGTLLAIDAKATCLKGAGEQLAAADAIVFGSPTYMGGRAGSSRVRRRIEQTMVHDAVAQQAGRRLHQQRHAHGDKFSTLTYMFTLSRSTDVLVAWACTRRTRKNNTRERRQQRRRLRGLMTVTPSDASPDEMVPGDLATARAFGERVVEALAKLA